MKWLGNILLKQLLLRMSKFVFLSFFLFAGAWSSVGENLSMNANFFVLRCNLVCIYAVLDVGVL